MDRQTGRSHQVRITGEIVDPLLTGTKSVAVKFTCFTRDENDRRIQCLSEFGQSVPTVKDFNMFILNITLPREDVLEFIYSSESLKTRWSRPLSSGSLNGETFMETEREVACHDLAK